MAMAHSDFLRLLPSVRMHVHMSDIALRSTWLFFSIDYANFQATLCQGKFAKDSALCIGNEFVSDTPYSS